MNPLLRSRYREIELLQQALGHIWDVEITRSAPGPMETTLAATRVDHCLVYRCSSNIPLLCTGARSDALWTISPITNNCSGGRFRGLQLNAGQLLLLDPGGEVYQQVAADQCQMAISIPTSLVERICLAEYGMTADALWPNWNTGINAKVTAHIATLIDRLLSDPWAATRWGMDSEANLAGHIISLAVTAGEGRAPRPSLAQRRRIVRVAEELMRGRLNNPPSILELCEATHVSRRLLFYAFRELLGRTPSAHAKILRLHAARRRIVLRSHDRCVQQVATDLGFGHLGQFAIDYALLFGESPSKTRPI